MISLSQLSALRIQPVGTTQARRALTLYLVTEEARNVREQLELAIDTEVFLAAAHALRRVYAHPVRLDITGTVLG
jgi:hypothetical protein